MKKLFDMKLIKHWGLSNENAYGVTMFCTTCDRLGVPRPVSLQNDYSVLNRLYEGDVLEACYRFGIVGLPYGCLAGELPCSHTIILLTLIYKLLHLYQDGLDCLP